MSVPVFILERCLRFFYTILNNLKDVAPISDKINSPDVNLFIPSEAGQRMQIFINDASFDLPFLQPLRLTSYDGANTQCKPRTLSEFIKVRPLFTQQY